MNTLIIAMLCQTTWAKAYGNFDGAGGNDAFCVLQTSDGGFLVGAQEGGTNDNGVLVKLDQTGAIQWSQTSTTAEWEWADQPVTSLIRTADGGYAGIVSPAGTGSFSFIFKVNSSGGLTWMTCTEALKDILLVFELWDIIQMDDGTYVAVGWGWISTGGTDPLLVRLNSNGTLSWIRNLPLTSSYDYDRAYSIVKTPDGGFAVAGWLTYGNDGLLLVKFSNTYAVQWAKTIRFSPPQSVFGLYGSNCLSLYQTATDTALVMVGVSGNKGLIAKINLQGNLVWAETLSINSGLYSVAQTQDNGYIVAGNSDNGPIIIKLDAGGNLVWGKIYTQASPNSEGRCAIQTSDGGYLFLGGNHGTYPEAERFFILKLDANGNIPNSDCLVDCGCSFSPVSPSLSAISTSLTTQAASVSRATYPLTSQPLGVTGICAPLEIKGENGSRAPGVSCVPCPGGLIFSSNTNANLSVFSPEGRLVYSGRLSEGRNRITLDPGVYLWVAGKGESYPYKGKAVVR